MQHGCGQFPERVQVRVQHQSDYEGIKGRGWTQGDPYAFAIASRLQHRPLATHRSGGREGSIQRCLQYVMIRLVDPTFFHYLSPR